MARLSGPRELRVSSAKQTIGYIESAMKSAASAKGILMFSLNLYQYQIEKQANGSETSK